MRGAHVLIRGGQIRPDQPVFDERDWTDRSGTGISGYIKSKALAKQAVWDFIEPERKAGTGLPGPPSGFSSSLA